MKIIKYAAIALALAGLAAGGAYSQSQPAQTWPQSASDLPADPAVTFGTLPNGMRYAIQKNARPEHQVALRLVIQAGSDQEEEDQRGLAHVLEHMAFRGSKNFPEVAGEYRAVAALQRLGLSFGGDTNAGTGWAQTTYMFDLPRSDAESINTGLALLRDVAGELTLSNASLDAERPIVLAEERARATPAFNSQVAGLKFMFRGEPSENTPIGKTEVIRTAPLARVRAFYEKYYRPERATLVVVGDIDPVAMEAQIKTLFGDWKGKGAAPPVVRARLLPRQPEFSAVTVPGATPQLMLTWRRPYDLAPDTRASQKKTVLEALALQAFNQRLSDVSQSPNPPFVIAQAVHAPFNQSAELTQIVAVPTRPDGWGEVVDAIAAARKQAVTFGFQQAEMDRVLAATRTQLQSKAAGANTRLSSVIANEIAESGNSMRVYTSPAADVALFEDFTRGLTLAEFNAALAGAFQGQGVLAQLVTPTDLPGGQQAFAARYAAADARPVTAMAAQAAKTWTHTSFGAPGKVVERSEAADVGVTFVRFANGVYAAIKPTKFTTDQILVQARFSGGRYIMAKDKLDPAWIWGNGFVDGGLTDLTAVEMNRLMTGKRVNIVSAIGDNAFMLSGATRPADLDLQLQVLTAMATAPGWRSTGLDQMKSALPTLLPTLRAQPAGVFALEGEPLIRNGDRRWVNLPAGDELAGLKMDEARARLTPVLKDAPIDVTVVGDTTVEAAIEAIAKTFGALPPRKGALVKMGQPLTFPAGGGAPVKLTHKGRADQGLFLIAWPTTGHWRDPRAQAPAKILQMVLEQRVLDALRSSQGKTYSPGGDTAFSYYFDDYGVIQLRIEASAADMPAINAAIGKIAADLRTQPITADELARAVGVRTEYWRRTQATNGYWVQVLNESRKDSRLLGAARTSLPNTQAVTIADVQAAANRWLKDSTAWRLEVVHE